MKKKIFNTNMKYENNEHDIKKLKKKQQNIWINMNLNVKNGIGSSLWELQKQRNDRGPPNGES